MDGFIAQDLVPDRPAASGAGAAAAFTTGLPIGLTGHAERRPARLPALCLRDFDAPTTVAPPPAAPPTLGAAELAADLAAARAEGFAEGRAAALAEAAATTEAAAVAALTTLAAGLRDAGTEAVRLTEAAAEETARLLIGMLAACLPASAAHLAEAEAAALAAAILPGLPTEPRLTVQVAPALVEGLAARLATLPPALAARVSLEPAPGLAPADIRLAWSAGRAARHPAAIWAAVTEILTPLGLGPAAGQVPSRGERHPAAPLHAGEDAP